MLRTYIATKQVVITRGDNIKDAVSSVLKTASELTGRDPGTFDFDVEEKMCMGVLDIKVTVYTDNKNEKNEQKLTGGRVIYQDR